MKGCSESGIGEEFFKGREAMGMRDIANFLDCLCELLLQEESMLAPGNISTSLILFLKSCFIRM